jgi:hypothetical protein
MYLPAREQRGSLLSITIDKIVDDYICNYDEALREEMRSFGKTKEPSLEDAIRRAALFDYTVARHSVYSQ